MGIIRKILMKIRNYEYFYRFKKSYYKIDKDFLEKVSKASNIPYRELKWNYIFTNYIYGCTALEYAEFQLYNCSHRYKKKFFLSKRTYEFNNKNYNGKATKEDKEIFDDKNIFNEKFKKYVNRKSLYCKDKSEKEILNFIESMDDIVIKPTKSFGGRGVEIIKKEEIDDKEELVKKLVDQEYLVEECLKQCKEMEELNPTSINTVRPFVIRTKNGEIKIISCIVRVGGKGARIDNISTGGAMYPVDVESGKIIGRGMDHFGNKYTYSSTGKFLVGFQIPKWNELKEAVIKAMDIVKNIGWVSFDVCIKEDGIEFVEGNIYPGPATFQLDGPKLEILKKYWNE